MSRNRIIMHPLVWVTFLLPFVIWMVFPILPTFDDWSSTPAPNPNPFTWDLLLPQRSYWRPFESIYGWMIGHYRWLMPWLPHLIVIMGHYVGTIILYYITGLLNFRSIARNIATIAFFISTGAIATTTACDGMSQTWVHTLGLCALYIYLRSLANNKENATWLIIIILATFVKENAICWGVAIPIFGYTFNFSSRRNMSTHILYGVSWAIAYAIIHFSIPVSDTYELNTDYFDFSIIQCLRGIALWFTYSWLPLDYTHLLYAPNRNLFFLALSIVCIIPFYLTLFYHCRFSPLKRKIVGLVCVAIVLASPHLITIFSLMHVYASICVPSLIIGVIINEIHTDKIVPLSFLLFAITSVLVNVEHCLAAKESGEVGRRLSLEAVKGVGATEVQRAFLLIVDNGETRYSNFYVLPWETFDWGCGILWENNYRWPATLDHEIIDNKEFAKKQGIIQDLLSQKKYDCVWVLANSEIKTYLQKK